MGAPGLPDFQSIPFGRLAGSIKSWKIFRLSYQPVRRSGNSPSARCRIWLI